MKWLAENWDKVFTGVLSAVVGGVIGFFTAISTVDKEVAEIRINFNKELAELRTKEIAEIKTDVTLLKARLEQSVDPRLKSFDGMGDKIGNLEARMLVVESQSTFLRSQSEIILRAQIGGSR